MQWTQRTSWRGQWPAEEGGTELEAEAELAEEGELAGAAELEAEEGELGGASAARNGHRGRVGGVSAAQSTPCMIKKTEAKSEREWPPAPLPRQLALLRQLTLLRQLALLQLTLLGLGLQLRAALLRWPRQLALLQLRVALLQLHVFARAPHWPLLLALLGHSLKLHATLPHDRRRRAIASTSECYSSAQDTRSGWPCDRRTCVDLNRNCIPEHD